MNRKHFLSITAASLAALLPIRSRAQFTEQQISNGLQVTSTGDVDVSQSAAGTQDVVILDDGRRVSEDGVYRTGSSQVVINDGQITSTGDVRVEQAASGQQTVYVETITSGMKDERCEVGRVIANPDTGQLFYTARDCCFYAACAADCQKTCRTCEGHGKYE